MNNDLDISSITSIHTTLHEIFNELENLKKQNKTPIKVLMSEKTYKTISPDYEVGEITGCFGLPLEISNSIRKYKVCCEKNEDKGENERMKKYQTWEAFKMLSEDHNLIFSI